MTRLLALASILALTGCATYGEIDAPAEPLRPAPGTCDAGAAQGFVGQKATTEAGASILAASRAKTLRWGPPRSAWTMDYREDRINVRYNDAMIITTVTCG